MGSHAVWLAMGTPSLVAGETLPYLAMQQLKFLPVVNGDEMPVKEPVQYHSNSKQNLEARVHLSDR